MGEEKTNKKYKSLEKLIYWLIFNLITTATPFLFMGCACFIYHVDFFNQVTIQDLLIITFSLSISTLSYVIEESKTYSHPLRYILYLISGGSAIINIVAYLIIICGLLQAFIHEELFILTPVVKNSLSVISTLLLLFNVGMVVFFEFFLDNQKNDNEDKNNKKANDILIINIK